jgi:4-hydroxy-2-oxoheptanedioate aldolase
MELPRNAFKRALAEGRQQIGLWSSLSSNYTSRSDRRGRLRLDPARHGAFAERPRVTARAAASGGTVSCAPGSASAWNDTVTIKRVLDVGAQSLLIPYVSTAGGGKGRQ